MSSARLLTIATHTSTPALSRSPPSPLSSMKSHSSTPTTEKRSTSLRPPEMLLFGPQGISTLWCGSWRSTAAISPWSQPRWIKVGHKLSASSKYWKSRIPTWQRSSSTSTPRAPRSPRLLWMRKSRRMISSVSEERRTTDSADDVYIIFKSIMNLSSTHVGQVPHVVFVRLVQSLDGSARAQIDASGLV